jgi:hypothetical protein
MVKIHFAAFWASFDPEVNFFRDSLLEGMSTVVTQDNPDIVFFSCFGDLNVLACFFSKIVS